MRKRHSARNVRKSLSNSKGRNDGPWTRAGPNEFRRDHSMFGSVSVGEEEEARCLAGALHSKSKENGTRLSMFRNAKELAVGVAEVRERGRLRRPGRCTGTGTECLAYHAWELSSQETMSSCPGSDLVNFAEDASGSSTTDGLKPHFPKSLPDGSTGQRGHVLMFPPLPSHFPLVLYQACAECCVCRHRRTWASFLTGRNIEDFRGSPTDNQNKTANG